MSQPVRVAVANCNNHRAQSAQPSVDDQPRRGCIRRVDDQPHTSDLATIDYTAQLISKNSDILFVFGHAMFKLLDYIRRNGIPAIDILNQTSQGREHIRRSANRSFRIIMSRCIRTTFHIYVSPRRLLGVSSDDVRLEVYGRNYLNYIMRAMDTKYPTYIQSITQNGTMFAQFVDAMIRFIYRIQRELLADH